MRFVLGILLCSVSLWSQDSIYFQQKVDYDIRIRLDDRKHQVGGDLRLTYTNNSPDTLEKIIFHLWPRAYSGTNTAFNRQLLRRGQTDFHFTERRQRGTLDSLYWKVGKIKVDLTYRPDHPDIGTLLLPRPLSPGDSVLITTSFRTVFPASWSRLGHVGQSYQATQWYPKPAVYDREGWHPMPYLDHGEFYSEFGDYRVKITLPRNYVVAATGVLQEREERAWLRTRAKATAQTLDERKDLATDYVTETSPGSASDDKTITYLAKDVHDFAWFADKRFKVLHDTLLLSTKGQPMTTTDSGSTQVIDVWSFFTESEAAHWVASVDYLKRATRFFSEHIGPYPYPQVTGVQSALSAGGGMEYPMITVIGLSGSTQDLDEVLTHEVGHNWFYGILANNERDHAWMDEGLTSYYEQRYMYQFYPEYDRQRMIIPGRKIDLNLLGYRYLARQGLDEPPNTTSDSLDFYNYAVAAYSKPQLLLEHLERKIGPDRLDEAMRAYYRKWQFRHPQPEDFFSVFRSAGIDVEESLRPGILTTTEGDFNNRLWFGEPGFRPRSLYPLLIPRLALGSGQDDTGGEIFLTPLAAFNANDGFQLGGAAHNRTLEPKPFEWLVAPLYAFGSNSLTGFIGGRLRLLRPIKGTQQALLSVGTQRFGDFQPTGPAFAQEDEVYRYTRTAVRGDLIFDHPPVTLRKSGLSLQYVRLNQERPDFSPAGELLENVRELRTDFISLGYHRMINKALTPSAFTARLEYKTRGIAQFLSEEHLRLEASLTGGYQYDYGKFLRWRFFGGYFLSNALRDRATYPTSAFSLIDNAASDYRYDGLYLGRNQDGSYEQQLERRQGGFRAPISPAFNFGRSNDYLLALNLDANLPVPLPLGVFLDAGLYGFRPTTSSAATGEFNWTAGFSLTLLDDRVGLYLPLVSDPDTRDLLRQRGNLLDRLSVRLDLSGWLPWRWVDDLL